MEDCPICLERCYRAAQYYTSRKHIKDTVYMQVRLLVQSALLQDPGFDFIFNFIDHMILHYWGLGFRVGHWGTPPPLP